jgi:hypothetical protein
VTDTTTLPAVIEPYALTIIHEEAVRFVQPADRAPNAGDYGANWAVCPSQPPTVECLEDDDARINYSAGWHLVGASNASAGHFRLHAGQSPNQSASLAFDVAAGMQGKLSYFYGTSTKGGSAEIFLDGASKGTVTYSGSAGSLKEPVFGPDAEFGHIAAGQHLLEIKNLVDGVYVDRICLESSSSGSQPASGPGPTSATSSSLTLGQSSSQSLVVGSGTTAISAVASSVGDLPVKLVLVSPSGSLLQAANSANGIAVITATVSQSGTYTLKVVNLSLGPVQVWTAATPTLGR